jgi:O-methyltransferase
MAKEPHSELNNLFRRNWTREDLTTMYTITPISTLSTSRMQAVMDSMRHVWRRNIPGDIVECGVFMGGNVALCLSEMAKLNITDKKFWAYDTFDGVPKSELIDTDREIELHSEGLGNSVETWYDEEDHWCRCPLEKVELNVENILGQLLPDEFEYTPEGYIYKKVNYIKGSVIETIPDQLPDQIAFARLDMDIAAPTKHALPYVWDRLAVGGVIHIDDYNMFGGVHEVVDEFLADKLVYTQEIDYAAISIVKVQE